MTQRFTTHRLAGTAIAAVLALSTTSVWAQDAAPTAEAPVTVAAPVAAPVAQPSPTIVLPPVSASPTTTTAAEKTTVSKSAPAPRVASSKPATPRAAAKPPASPVARVASAPVATPAAAAPISEASPIAPVAETDALPSDLAGPPPVATAAAATSDGSNDLLLAGLAGALGLGAIGLFAATRRRRMVEPDYGATDYEPVSEPVVPVANAADIAAPRRADEPMPTTAQRIEMPQRYATLAAPAFTPLKSWTEPRVQRSEPVDTRVLSLNREALLDRMVAAEPDANNPFTSAKARRKRARIMLQSMDNDRWEDAELAPGFDWRQMAEAVEKRESIDA